MGVFYLLSDSDDPDNVAGDQEKGRKAGNCAVTS